MDGAEGNAEEGLQDDMSQNQQLFPQLLLSREQKE